MPWTIGDVNRHKQGLTDTQKRQWVRIANNALRKCQANSGNNCDASAIRQANGAVRTNLRSVLSANAEYTARREVHNGRTHLVAPVIIMVEGVHAGNHGPLYHPVEELGAAVDAWNGRPVTISHPKSGGEHVSVSQPGILQRYGVGNVLDVHMEGDQLRGWIWVDETKLQQKSPEAHRVIERGEPLEVSAGLFSEDEQIGGQWNDETYNAISRNHRPDHLALLPGEVGACSWDDGCGVRANMKGGNNEMKKDENSQLLDKEQYLENLLNNADAGYREKISTIQDKLNAMDTDIKAYYLSDVYDDYFVYEIRSREGLNPPKMYKRNYSVNDSGEIEFAEEPAEVRKQVSYVALSGGGLKRTKLNKSKKEVTIMSDKSDKPCDGCEALVAELITNERTKFTEDHREWLLTLEEDQLALLVQDEMKEEKKDPPEKKEPAPQQLNAEQVKEIVKGTFKTQEDFLAIMPEDLREQTRSGLKLHQEQKSKMVKAILENTEDIWKEDQLKGMEIETLQKVFKSVVNVETVADYSLQVDSPGSDDGIAPLMRVAPIAKSDA